MHPDAKNTEIQSVRQKVIYILVTLLIISLAASFYFLYQKSDRYNLKYAQTVIKENAFNSSNVDWEKEFLISESILTSEKHENSFHNSLSHLLKSLKDNHSRVISDKKTHKSNVKSFTDYYSKNETPVVVINNWSGTDVEGAYLKIKENITKAVTSSKCGIIVDISKNYGGNVWPMANGISALISEGVIGSFVDSNGKVQEITNSKGVIKIRGMYSPFREDHSHVMYDKKVAVVSGRRTASSGEILSIFMRGQPNVKFFGEPTMGVPTSNRVFKLPNNVRFALTTAVTRDRNNVIYSKSISPDVVTKEPIKLSLEWINESCQ